MQTAARYREDVPLQYPAHLVEHSRLPDGTNITVRPIRPQDDDIQSVFLDGLSSETRYNRLLSGRKLTPDEIRHLTRIDYDQEMAFIAVTSNRGEEREVGVVRYVMDADGSGAEFALVVADSWQHQGIGTLLMSTLLRHALSVGIIRMHGIAFSSNRAMLNLARKLGFATKKDPSDSTVLELVKALQPTIQ